MQTLKKFQSSKLIRNITLYIIIIVLLCLAATSLACYFIVWPRLKETAIDDARNTTTEIRSQIDNYITNLTDTSLFIADSNELKNAFSAYTKEPTEQYYNRTCLVLNDLCTKMSNIRSVLVTTDDDISFSSLTDITNTDYETAETLASISSKARFSPIYMLSTSPETYSLCYMYRRSIKNVSYNFFFFYKVNSIVNAATLLSESSFDSFALYDSPQNIFYGKEIATHLEDYLVSAANISYPAMHPQSDGYYFTEPLNNYNWHFTAYASNRTITATVFHIFLLVLLFSVIFSVITLLLVITVISHFITPLNDLNVTMVNVANGDLKSYSNIQTNDEIENLSKIFNHMLDRINEHIETRIAYENKEQRMHYNLLIAQIDSHFICNTMSVINSMARKNMNTEIVEANTALIKIIQNCLRVKTYSITDTITQELDILKQYLIIERLRYKNDAQVIIDVPDELMSYEIPKNILQPIVENSFLHGLMDLDTGEIQGVITLVIYLMDHMLVIEITDTGKGIDSTRLSILNAMDDYIDQIDERGKHIGLLNIRKRLEYIYNGKSTMTFHNDDGFTVKITLPILSEERGDTI